MRAAFDEGGDRIQHERASDSSAANVRINPDEVDVSVASALVFGALDFGSEIAGHTTVQPCARARCPRQRTRRAGAR